MATGTVTVLPSTLRASPSISSGDVRTALFGVAQIIGVILGTAVAVAAGSTTPGYLAVAVAVPALGAALLMGCGQKGPLVLPTQAQAATPPAPAASAVPAKR